MSLPYYKRFPRDFLEATIGMTLEVKGAYGIILDLIYMHSGHLPNDHRYIAGQLGCSTRSSNKIINELVERKKLQILDGFISNFRADLEIENALKLCEKNTENGKKNKKTNYLTKPDNKPDDKPKGRHSDSESDIEDSEAKASAAKAALPKVNGNGYDPEPPDTGTVIFNQGLNFLVKASGRPENAIRSLLGKWRKTYGDVLLVTTLGAAQREHKLQALIEPIGWVEKALQSRGQQKDRAEVRESNIRKTGRAVL